MNFQIFFDFFFKTFVFAGVKSVPDGDMEFTSLLTGNRLPNARRVSVEIHGNTTGPNSNPTELPNISMMVMQFGQFLDHDLTLTPSKSPILKLQRLPNEIQRFFGSISTKYGN